jgi:hypothetical protein
LHGGTTAPSHWHIHDKNKTPSPMNYRWHLANWCRWNEFYSIEMQTTNETVTYINGITFDSVYTITYSITFLETTLCISILQHSIGSLTCSGVCQIC